MYPNLRLACFNANRMWNFQGALHHGFYGLIDFLECMQIYTCLVQELNSPHCAALPSDQPYWYLGPDAAMGRDARFLVHQRVWDDCVLVPEVSSSPDLHWILFRSSDGQACSAIASFYAPDVSRSPAQRLEFWMRFSASTDRVRQLYLHANLVLAGDCNLWLPSLVSSCSPRPADKHCIMDLENIQDHHGLLVQNGTELPTHRRGAALDIVLASEGIVSDLSVHDGRSCPCAEHDFCCPLLRSNHFAMTFVVLQAIQHSSSIPSARRWPHVDDWAQVIANAKADIEDWHARVSEASAFSNVDLLHRRSVLDVLTAHLCSILWEHASRIYPLPRVARARRKQPVWWTQECYRSMVSWNAAWRAHRRRRTAESQAAL